MPPPSLLRTTIRTGSVGVPKRGEGVGVVVQAEVAGDDPGGRPGGHGRADARRRPGRRCRWRRGWPRKRTAAAAPAAESLLVADRHRGSRVDEIAVARRAPPSARVHARLAQVRRRRLVERLGGGLVGGRQRLGPALGRVGVERRRQLPRRAPPARPGPSPRPGAWARSSRSRRRPRAAGSSAAPPARRAAPCWSASRRSAGSARAPARAERRGRWRRRRRSPVSGRGGRGEPGTSARRGSG